MSTESDTPENPSPAQDPQEAAPAPQQQYVDPRRRLRELLAVPERDRTDAQWDEINELEIQLAPGNRIGPGQPGAGAPMERGSGGGGGGGGGGRPPFQQKKHPGKGGGKRRPRPGGNPNKQPQ